MKTNLLTLTLILSASVCTAQTQFKGSGTSGQPYKLHADTPKYTIDEPTILQISNILSMANDLAATSDKISANQYNAYIKQIQHVDSILRIQYLRYHPKTVKNP